MSNIKQSLKILDQVSNLDLSETPVFTWDEMQVLKRKHANYCVWVFMIGHTSGVIVGILLYILIKT